MKLVELFCGTGGFSRGAHDAGFEVSAAYDIDKTLTAYYLHNFPSTKLFHRDIATLTGDEIRRAIGGQPFGVFGGPPCQGFSDIGKRDPTDPRRSLLKHFFRIVADLQPSFFVMENVRGLTYRDVRGFFEDAVSQVDGTYDIGKPRVWDAANFGAATRRNRMLLVGIRRDLRHPFIDSSLEAFIRPAATVRDALEGLNDSVALAEDEAFPGIDRWQLRNATGLNAYAMKLCAKNGLFTGHKKSLHSPKVVDRFSKTEQGVLEPVGRHPRLALDGQCPTLRAGTGSDLGSYQAVRPIHPTENRVITVREAARLQGFPDQHLFHPTIWHSFRMIGNSVSPIMASAVFAAIAKHMGLSTSHPTGRLSAERLKPKPEVRFAAE